jgi:hypothetical protein
MLKCPKILENFQAMARSQAVGEVSPKGLSPADSAKYSGMKPETIEH